VYAALGVHSDTLRRGQGAPPLPSPLHLTNYM
jgi:hypothetical protein